MSATANRWVALSAPPTPGWYAVRFCFEGKALPDTAYFENDAWIAIVRGATHRSAEPFDEEEAAFGWGADHLAEIDAALLGAAAVDAMGLVRQMGKKT